MILQLNTVLYNLETLAEELPSYWNPDTQGIDVLEKLNYFSTFPFLWLDMSVTTENVSISAQKLIYYGEHFNTGASVGW